MIYKRHGYENRAAYLNDLAENLNVDFGYVSAAADMLGAGEDFDGLVSVLEDAIWAGLI